MGSYKVAVIGLVIFCALACLAVMVWLGLSFRVRRSPVLQPTRSLQPADLAAIEKAIGFKLPGSHAVRAIALLHGKDSVLFLKVIVPSDYASELMRTVSSHSTLMKPARVPRSTSDVVPWFAASEGDIAAGFDQGLGTYVIFCVPEADSTTLLICVSSMSKRLSKDIYDLF